MYYTIEEKIDGKFEPTYRVLVTELDGYRKLTLMTTNHESWCDEHQERRCITIIDDGNGVYLPDSDTLVGYDTISELINVLTVALNHNAPKYESKITAHNA